MSKSDVFNCSREMLEEAVRSATSMADVLAALDLPGTGGNYRALSSRLHDLAISTDHFARKRASKYTRELLDPIVKRCRSISQVLNELGLSATGGNHRLIQSHIRRLELSTGHFAGQGWNRGLTADTDPSVARMALRNALPDSSVSVEKAPAIAGYKLVERLLRHGWEYRCAECGLDDWRRMPLRLQLDHVNGVSNDNRFENLRLLCPNCHSQTETFGGRNRKKANGARGGI